MKKQDILFWVVFVLIELLYVKATFATTINLGYSECQNFTTFNETDNSTANLTICAPALNVPPAQNFNLSYTECSYANNVTSCCRAWDNSSCPAPQTCPALSNYVFNNVPWGQPFQGVGNVSGYCEAWNNASCYVPPVCVNTTITNTTYVNITSCPMANQNIDLYPGDVYSNFTYGIAVNCHQSLSQPSVVYVPQLLSPMSVDVNCSATETKNFADRNVSINIQQCSFCPYCNVSAICPARPDDAILNCSIKASFCYSDLSDFVSFDAFQNGNATTVFNNSKNAILAQRDAAVNDSAQSNKLRQEAQDQYAVLKASTDDNQKMLIAICIILVVVVLVNYLKSRDVKAAVSPKNL